MITRLEAHGYRCFPSLSVDPAQDNADFGKLAAVMSVRQCQDPAFSQLRDHLRAWFPEQP